MAFETGTAANYADLMYRIVNFATTNSTLVGLGQNWSINRGVISSQVTAYITDSSYEIPGALTFGADVALGDVDEIDSPLGYRGWAAYVAELDKHLGVQFASATLPVTYSITGPGWTSDESDQAPNSWVVEYSDDGSSWTTSDTETGETSWTVWETRTYNINQTVGTHAYWRIRFTANNGDASLLRIARLRFFDNTPTWISYRYSPEYLLEGPGLSGSESIYCGMRLHKDSTSDYFNIGIIGASGYASTETFIDQPQRYGVRGVLLWDSSIPYWLVVNGQRIIVVAKVSTIYTCMYLGKIFAYGTPTQYPYPMLVSGAQSSANGRWSESTGANHRHIQCPSYATALYMPGGNWYGVQNNYTSNTNDYSDSNYTNSSKLSPTNYNSFGNGAGILGNIIPAPDGSYTLWPLEIMNTDPSHFGVFGQVDGIFWVSGNSNASENIITKDSVDYLVFQNVHRTGNMDYAALKLE